MLAVCQTGDTATATFELPLSGNVNQAIWTAFMSPLNDQYGLININLCFSLYANFER